jgi:hypothetical protein
MLSYALSNIDDKLIIKAIKNEYKNYNIALKTQKRNSISIQTDLRKITINRTLLIPKTSDDRLRLFQRDGRYGIYPLDILLGIVDLPFKMTVNTMLLVSKKAIQSSSFQHAAESLEEDNGIKLSPCTIDDVTQYIGYLVFKKNYELAYKSYLEISNGQLSVFNKKEKGVLYLQVDGSMINTRERNSVGSGWRETKLGLVYDSSNVKSVERTNKYGKRVTEYKIIKKDYTAYIGSAKEFQKFFFECAFRNGYGVYKDTVIISDGAKWIRTMKDELFPDAQQILDFFHLSEKIWELGKLYFNIKDIHKEQNTKNYNYYSQWCNSIIDSIEDSKYNDIKSYIAEKEHKVNKRKIVK